jgi:ribosomal protein S18 acetylase RimI-like enzyme
MPSTVDYSTISFRPVVAEDHEFLAALYASTREDELRDTGWPDAQKAAFLRMQFEAQLAHYAEHYAEAERNIILLAGEPIGRLWIYRMPSEIRIVDISLIPSARKRGIGRFLLERVIAEAAAKRAKVTIHVERFNPAMHLYQRLGFGKVREVGPYDFMERPIDPFS